MKKQGLIPKLMLGKETTARLSGQVLRDNALQKVVGASVQLSLSSATDTTPLCA